MKKVISIIMAVLMIASLFATMGSAKSFDLQFNEDGNFTIVHLTDIQDDYPMNKTTKQYINEMLDDIKPDLVVLGGDNTVCDAEDKDAAIKEICDIFVEHETYFTLVFGNHDHQQMFADNTNQEGGPTKQEQVDLIKEQLLAMYQIHGGRYCLATDENPELFGVGTHNLPIMSSDGSKVAWNIYMFDSNAYYPNEDADIGYDAVHTDEIKWYEDTAAKLKENNGGKVVPALAFQHIIVQEIYDELFIASPFSWGDIGEDFEGTGKEGVYHFSYLPKVANIKDGFLFEKPCPGYYNYGELDSMVKTGDVKGIFSGHDHTNNFTVEIDGINVSNTGGCTYYSYGSDLNRGVRVIELSENSDSYNSYTYTVAEACLKDGSKITDFGDITTTSARFALFGKDFLNGLMAVLKVMFFFVK